MREEISPRRGGGRPRRGGLLSRRVASPAAAAWLAVALLPGTLTGQEAKEGGAAAFVDGAPVLAGGPDVLGGGAGAAGGPGVLLEVPFIPQSEALCGGAAAAMVLRYWGAAGAAPEDFAHLVREAEGGIRTHDLARAVEGLGWRTLPFRAELAELRGQVSQGRPVIVLLAVGGGRFHYVVIAGWAGEVAVLHDPARAPYRFVAEEELARAWSEAGRWALLVLPPGGEGPRGTAEAWDGAGSPGGTGDAGGMGEGGSAGEAGSAGGVESAGDGAPGGRSARHSGRSALGASPVRSRCAEGVAAGVGLARGGELEKAAAALEVATLVCGESGAALRELAGVRLRQGRTAEALELVRRAAATDPEDVHALRTLAAAHYLAGEEEEALRVWHRLGATRVGAVRVDGLARTRHGTAVALLGLEAGGELAPEGLALARRRLASLPAADGSRVDYVPLPGGVLEVRAAVAERPAWPASPGALAVGAVRALVEGQAAATAGALLGAGESWRLRWRWSPERPLVEASVAVPGVGGVPGVLRVSGAWEGETHAAATGPEREERRRVALGLESWAAPWLLWEAGASLERWSGRGAHAALSGAAEARTGGDRLAVRMEVAGWAPVTGSPTPSGAGPSDPGGAPAPAGPLEPAGTPGAETFAAAGLGATWRSRRGVEGTAWTARAGVAWADPGAPRSVWPGAGTGRGRPILLRAHPLLREGVVAGPVFGPGVAHGGVEGVRWLGGPFPLRLGLAAFVDAAAVWLAPGSERGPLHVDAGAGLRLGLPGDRGALRIDAARGLRDGAFAVSVGWATAATGSAR